MILFALQAFTMSALAIPYLDPLSQLVANTTSPAIRANLTLPEYLETFSASQQHEQLTGVNRSSFTTPAEGGVELWIYKTEGINDDVPLPYIYYIHGGGWSVGRYVRKW